MVGRKQLVLGRRDDDLVLVVVASLVLRDEGRDQRQLTARELLDQRLVKGELSEEEYERKRAALEGRDYVDR